jgi:osmoprotectant transport system permease protein
MGFVELLGDRWPVLSYLAYQHMSLVVQTLILATVLAVIIGILIYRSPVGVAIGNTAIPVGLTIPSYALLGVLVGIVGLGVVPSVMPTPRTISCAASLAPVPRSSSSR